MVIKTRIDTVYLAGPMTGIQDYNYPRFHELADKIRDNGFIVRNPAESFNGDQSASRAQYAVHDAALIAHCDAVAVMDGWEHSHGARFETHEAALLGLPVICAEALANPSMSIEEIWVDQYGAPVSKPHPAQAVLDAFWDTHPNIKRLRRVSDTPLGFREEYSEKVHDFMGTPDFAGAVDGGGYKSSMDDTGKLPIWLVPNSLIYAAARALQHGAKKYAPNNWRRGMEWTEVYSALQRHILAWHEGEDIDKDSGLNHLDHAVACLAFLTEYSDYPEFTKFDNRFKGGSA